MDWMAIFMNYNTFVLFFAEGGNRRGGIYYDKFLNILTININLFSSF